MPSDSTDPGHYVIQARMRVTAGKQTEFADLMLAHVPIVVSQPGVLQYEFYQNDDDDRYFMLYEVFENIGAWEKMHAMPGTDQMFARIGPLIESRERSLWTAVPIFAQPLAAPVGPAQHAVTSTFLLKAGTAAALADEIAADTARVHAAGSIIRFDLNRDTENPLRFMICSRWPDRARWEDHQNDPHFLNMRQRTTDYYDGPSERLLWKPAVGR